MNFKTECLEDFLEMFRQNRKAISSVEGCLSVELFRDLNNPCIMFTYSRWTDEKYLDLYRDSELFGKIWPQTKLYFAAPAEAWSLEEMS